MSLKQLLLSAVIVAGVFHLGVGDAHAATTSANNAAAATAASDVDYVSAENNADDYLNARPANANDPLEGFNRSVFVFNKGVDMVVLRPLSQVYHFILPAFLERRMGNFFTNLNAPVVILNSVLQGNPQNSFVSFWRFVFNSTLGVAGFFDIATELGVPEQHTEDFGQTLSIWGMGEGPYLVLPLFGPSNLRDTLGLPVDFLSDPFRYMIRTSENFTLWGVRIIDTRARFGKIIDDTYDASLDPYATFRSLYLQRRNAMIENKGTDSGVAPKTNISE
jgi:phospholipid-binding lipoprotein MlaA